MEKYYFFLTRCTQRCNSSLFSVVAIVMKEIVPGAMIRLIGPAKQWSILGIIIRVTLLQGTNAVDVITILTPEPRLRKMQMFASAKDVEWSILV